jgi:S1-C subfamily serine protease
MALPNFVAKSTVDTRDLLPLEGVPALDRFQFLRDQIVAIAGRDVAALFAEPIVSYKGARAEIAWYTERSGEPVAFSSLDGDARRNIGEKLQKYLSALEPMLHDAKVGPVLARALYIPAPEDIIAVGQEPVLIRWGIVPNSATATGSLRAEQFASTLGPYAPFGATSITLTRARAVEPTPLPGPKPTTADSSREAPLSGASNRGLYIATAAAALAALLLTLPGFLSSSPMIAEVGDGGLPAAQEITKTMAEKVEQARAALATADCNSDGSFGPRPTEPGRDRLPPAPIPLKPQEGSTQGDMALVAERAAQSVVFVFTCTDQAGWEEEHKDDKEKSEPTACPKTTASNSGQDDQTSEQLLFAGSGSGFFIDRNTIVTNTHVVEGAKAVFVTNHFLGRVQPAKVLAATVKQRVADPDFAVIQIDAEQSPPGVALTTSVARLQNVVAAGFPGIIIEEDSNLRRLVKGDPGAAPEVTTFPGFVTLTMSAEGELPLIFSSAVIGHGNSGGPLLDLCARAVGMNTLGWSGEHEDTGYKVNVAEGAKALMTFLDTHHVGYQKGEDACNAASTKPESKPSPTPEPPKSGALTPTAPRSDPDAPPAVPPAPKSSSPPVSK